MSLESGDQSVMVGFYQTEVNIVSMNIVMCCLITNYLAINNTMGFTMNKLMQSHFTSLFNMTVLSRHLETGSTYKWIR
jgi:hypothetical protein